VQKEIDTIKKGFADQKQFEDALKNAGIDPAGLEEQVRSQLVTKKLVEALSKDVKKPTDAEIKQYFDSNKAEFAQLAGKRASHILVKDEATAKKVLAAIKSGEDFGKLAKEYSIDTVSAQQNGDLGYPDTPYVAEFQAALDKLKIGALSGIVKTQFGFHIIKATEARDAKQKSLDDVRAEIEKKIAEQKRADLYQRELDKLRKQAKIEILVKDLAVKATGSTTTTGTK
jgi:foldase protein PrsA